MSIPYRTRQALKRIAITLLVTVLVAVLLWLCWVLWLGRYVVYTRDGAVIDMDQSSAELSGEPALPPEDGDPIQIYYNEGDAVIQNTAELAQVSGFYISQEDLEGDLTQLRSQLQALPAGTPVMIDLKNSAGDFFYSSSVGKYRADTVEVKAVDELIKLLNQRGLYTIARVCALRDFNYGLNNVPDGIHHRSMLYLWQDEGGCYWLDPTSQGTMTYLTGIANELKALGFNEVVFSEFKVPDSDQIAFSADKLETLQTAAKTIVKTCGSDSFAVSFGAPEGFVLPEGRCRLYVENAEPVEAQAIAENSGVPDITVHLVFVTALHDTRFDEFGVLRPLSTADMTQFE